MVKFEAWTQTKILAAGCLLLCTCYFFSLHPEDVEGSSESLALLQGRVLRHGPVHAHRTRFFHPRHHRLSSLNGDDMVYDGDGDEVPLSGFGGLGRRAHFTIGPHVRRLVKQHKATVTWRTWREEQDDGWGSRDSLTPRVTLNVQDKRRGATLSTARAQEARGSEEGRLAPSVHVREGTVHVGVAREEEPRPSWARPAFHQDALKRQHEQGVLDFSVSSSMQGNTSLDFHREPRESAAADNCGPSSPCALVRQLNSEHLSGTHEVGASDWSPSVQASKNSVWTNSKDGEDVSSCQVCVEHYLADAGPGRYLVGSTLRRQVLRGPCLPFCS